MRLDVCIFCGLIFDRKLNENKAAPYDILVNDGLVYDIDPEDLDRWYADVLFMGPSIEALIAGASISYTEACTALPTRGYPVASSPTRSYRLANLSSLNTVLSLPTRQRSRVFYAHGRRIFQNIMYVSFALSFTSLTPHSGFRWNTMAMSMKGV